MHAKHTARCGINRDSEPRSTDRFAETRIDDDRIGQDMIDLDQFKRVTYFERPRRRARDRLHYLGTQAPVRDATGVERADPTQNTAAGRRGNAQLAAASLHAAIDFLHRAGWMHQMAAFDGFVDQSLAGIT